MILIGIPKRYKPYVLFPGLVVMFSLKVFLFILAFHGLRVFMTGSNMTAILSNGAPCIFEQMR